MVVSFNVSSGIERILSTARASLLLCLLLIICPAGSALQLDGSQDRYLLTPHLHWYADHSGKLKLEEILQPAYRAQFMPYHESTFNLGFVDYPVWFHIALHRSQIQNQNTALSTYDHSPWHLLIDYAPLDLIDIYQRLPNGRTLHRRMGDTLPFDQREFRHHAFITPLHLPQGETVDLFIRVETSSTMQMPLSVYSPGGSLLFSNNADVLYGAYYGIMVIMALYNLFVFFVLREHSYIYYVLHTITFTVVQATVSGHAYRYLWPDAPSWNQLSIPVLMQVNFLCALAFSRRFLSLSQYAPRLDRLMIAASVVVILGGAFSFIGDYRTTMLLNFTAVTIVSLLIIVSGVILLLKGHRIARLFLLAWVILDISVIIQVLATATVLPSNVFTLHAGLIGASFEVVLLSLALAYRFNARIRASEALAHESSDKLLKANLQLNTAIAQQSRLLRLKDNFLATISHELRTPMNGVEGALELLKTDNLSQKHKDYMDAAKRSARDMTAKIDAILRFSEIQSGELRIKQDAMEIREVLNPLIDEARNKCLRKGLALSFHIDRQVPVVIEADADQITHVMKQLIDNAVKFTRQGQIRVYISSDWDEVARQDRLSISIIDTGSGISQDKLTAIFNPFEHAESGSNHTDHGLGIGLIICKQLVELMGGQFSIDSRPGAGTEITVQLPLRVAAYSLPVKTPVENLNPLRRTVLIAEDNPVNQLVLKGMLEKLGCMTITAGNGAEVCEILKAQPVDLILMDCQMPVMDGFETTRAIRAGRTAYSNLPIIAVTANAMSQDNKRCLDAGMNDYLRKPINRQVLENKVIRWLNCGRIAAF